MKYITCILLSLLTGSHATGGTTSKGYELFHVQCTGCHHFGHHATGPDLCGIYKRVSGSAKGYAYSEAMKSYKTVWDKKTIQHFLASPITIVPGTKMGILGFDNASDRQALAEYVINRSQQADCR